MAEQPNIDAKTREQQKSREEQAADIAYTVNHSISCGLTDIIVQPAAAVLATTLVHEDILPRWMHKITDFFEHDHDDHAGHDHASHAPKKDGLDKFRTTTAAAPTKLVAEDVQKAKWQRVRIRLKEELKFKNLFHNLSHWATGEVAGDVGGIVPTVIVQRTFPGFMDGMRKVLEPVAGGLFRGGAKRDAQHWGKKHNFAPDSDQVKQKEATLYEHEISHLPQAVMWNVFSIPINYFTQLAMSKPGHRFTIKEFIIGKTFGSFFSNAVLIGGRGMAPEMFNEIDRFNSKHVIKPVMQTIGINEKTIDKIHAEEAKERGDDDWQGRLKQRASEAEQMPETGRLA